MSLFFRIAAVVLGEQTLPLESYPHPSKRSRDDGRLLSLFRYIADKAIRFHDCFSIQWWLNHFPNWFHYSMEWSSSMCRLATTAPATTKKDLFQAQLCSSCRGEGRAVADVIQALAFYVSEDWLFNGGNDSGLKMGGDSINREAAKFIPSRESSQI